MGKLHLFELRSGHILLDGVTIRGIRECEFSIKENDSLAELSLKMDVRKGIFSWQSVPVTTKSSMCLQSKKGSLSGMILWMKKWRLI